MRGYGLRRGGGEGAPGRGSLRRGLRAVGPAVLSAAAHAGAIAAAAYGLPWMEPRAGADVAAVAATIVSQADFAAASSRGRPEGVPAPGADASASASAPAEPPDSPEADLAPGRVNLAPPSSPEAVPTAASPAPATPEAAVPPPPVSAPPEVVAPRPRPRPDRPPRPQAAEVRPPPAQGAAGRASTDRSGAGRGDRPGRTALEEALGAAVRARLVERQELVERALERTGRVSAGPLLQLTITRDGRLAEARVVRSSGSAVVDAAAVRAARSVGRFPAAPDDLPGASFTFRVRMAPEAR